MCPASRTRSASATRWLTGWISRYRVTIGVCAAFALASVWARVAFGDDAADEVVTRLGYGLPALEAGRPWTVATGFALEASVSLLPQPITVVALFLCERVASHWRTLVVFFGGHVVAVLVAAATFWALTGSSSEWASTMGRILDVGSSNGAFACLGAWTAFLRAPTRRRVRVGISCYLAMMLLLSGHVYDVSHPVGWIAGLSVGHVLTRGTRRHFDTGGWSSRELPWLAVVVAVGIAYGVYYVWHAGGNGGPFGWGPGSLR